MSRLRVEPLAQPADALERSVRQAQGQSVDLRGPRRRGAEALIGVPDPRSALAVAGLAACLIGLLGTDAGLVFVVVGVWAVRAMADAPVGLAWGLACAGAGMRWGTLNLADVGVATRLTGPSVVAGSIWSRAGMIAALIGAVVSEAQTDGFGASSWAERAAAAATVAGLVPLFVVAGAGDPARELLVWGIGAVLGTVVVVLLARHVSRVPLWAPVVLVAAGVAVAVTVS